MHSLLKKTNNWCWTCFNRKPTGQSICTHCPHKTGDKTYLNVIGNYDLVQKVRHGAGRGWGGGGGGESTSLTPLRALSGQGNLTSVRPDSPLGFPQTSRCLPHPTRRLPATSPHVFSAFRLRFGSPLIVECLEPLHKS